MLFPTKIYTAFRYCLILEVTPMKLVTAVVAIVVALSASAFAQTSPEIDKALSAAPAQMKDGATVIK